MLLGCNTSEHENAAANDATDAQHCSSMQHDISHTQQRPHPCICNRWI